MTHALVVVVKNINSAMEGFNYKLVIFDLQRLVHGHSFTH